MTQLVDDILFLSELEQGREVVALGFTELAPYVSEIFAENRERALRAELSLEQDVPAGIVVPMRPRMLLVLLGNLLDNALRYAGDGGPITVAAKHAGERVVVTVEDCGPGVPSEALARLGEPFYRPDTARARETGGVGLGLAIVRSSVAACGGEVRFANRTPRGFVAEITLAAS